jgi:hypothetical protein
VLPSKIVAVGLNYKDHAAEQNKPLPAEPMIFIKPSTAVIGPDDPIMLPANAGRVDHEAEVGVVIGARAWQVSEADAHTYIFGITCVNDVTARELQVKDVQYTRAKGFDTFAPVGPCVRRPRPHQARRADGRGVGERRPPAGVVHQGTHLSDPAARGVHLIGDDAAARRHHFDRHAGRHRPARSGRSRQHQGRRGRRLTNPVGQGVTVHR